MSEALIIGFALFIAIVLTVMVCLNYILYHLCAMFRYCDTSWTFLLLTQKQGYVAAQFLSNLILQSL